MFQIVTTSFSVAMVDALIVARVELWVSLGEVSSDDQPEEVMSCAQKMGLSCHFQIENIIWRSQNMCIGD